jgi:hypothetical protein
MKTNVKRLGVAALAMAALTLGAGAALAQRGAMTRPIQMAAATPAVSPMQLMGRRPFTTPFLGTFSPGFQARSLGTTAALASSLTASSLTASSLATPYGGVDPYGYGGYYSYPDPYGGGLRGAA